MEKLHPIRIQIIKENLKDMHELRIKRAMQKRWDRDSERYSRLQGRIDFLNREIQVATIILDGGV